MSCCRRPRSRRCAAGSTPRCRRGMRAADLIRRTLEGALASLPARAGGVATAAAEQLAAASELRSEVDAAYAGAQREVEEAMRSGSLLRGEVLARWHEVVGTGDVMRALESRVGWVRDRVKSVVTGKPAPDEELRVAVENRIEAVVRAAAERASERASRAWRERVPGSSTAPEFDRRSTVPRVSSRPAPKTRSAPGRDSCSTS